MHAKITILVHRTHWHCKTCRLMNTHMVSIDQHLQTHHGDFVSPLAISMKQQLPYFLCKGTDLSSYQTTTTRTPCKSSLQQEVGSHSDGELDISSGCTRYEETLSGIFTQENKEVTRLGCDRNEKSGKQDTSASETKKVSAENRGKNAVTKCQWIGKRGSKPAKSSPKVPTDESDKHQKPIPLQTRSLTRAAFKQERETNQNQKQYHTAQSSFEVDAVQHKANAQEACTHTDERQFSSESWDESDKDSAVMSSMVMNKQNKRPWNSKIGEKDKISPMDKTPKSVKRDRKRKQMAEDDTKAENCRKKKKRGRPQKAKSKESTSHSDEKVKKPGLGGKPVKRTAEVSITERKEIIDYYVITMPQDLCSNEDSTNSVSLAKSSKTAADSLLSESVSTEINHSVPSSAGVNPMDLHVTGVVANMPENESNNGSVGCKRIGPLFSVELEDRSSEKSSGNHSTSHYVPNGMLTAAENGNDDSPVIQDVLGQPLNNLDGLNVAMVQISHSGQHASQADSSHQVDGMLSQSVTSIGLPSLNSNKFDSGVTSVYLHSQQYLSSVLPSSGTQIFSEHFQPSVSSSDANQYTFSVCTNVHQNNAVYHTDSIHPHSSSQTTSNTEALHVKGAENAESKEWLKNKVRFSFINTKTSARGRQAAQIFECKVCQAKYSSAEGLSHHMSKMSSQTMFQCRSCLKTFHNMHTLSLHVFGEHEKRKKPCCFSCKEKFQTMEEFERHLHHHLGNKDLKLFDSQFHTCQVCKEDVICKPAIMHKHYYCKHKITVCFQCFVRSELVLLSDTAKVQEHRLLHMNFCNICTQDIPVTESMEAHNESHSSLHQEEDGQGQVCDRCNQWCPNKVSLAIHHKEHKQEIVRHWREQKWDVGLACTLCDKVLRNKRNLQRHMDQQHSISRSYKFHCEFCGKGEDSRSTLKDHIALHHLGIKRYMCEFCPQRFANSNGLKRHILKDHATDKQYVCEFCGKKFCDKFSLTRHMFVHTGRSRFVCEQCGKAFHACSDFRKHLSVHTEKREFVCQRCCQGFKRREHLTRHITKCPKATQN